MNLLRVVYFCSMVILMHNTRQSVALICAQCNIRFLGVRNECHEPRNVSGCIGCMKTVAKVKLRDSGYIDGWEKLAVVTSRFCISPGNINVKPAGCYKQLNNGGYTERCYCYSDYCNSRASRTPVAALSAFFFLPFLSVPPWAATALSVLLLAFIVLCVFH